MKTASIVCRYMLPNAKMSYSLIDVNADKTLSSVVTVNKIALIHIGRTTIDYIKLSVYHFVHNAMTIDDCDQLHHL